MRRVVLSLLMLAMLIASSAFVRSGYLCTMDGKVRSSACCPAQARHRAAPVTAMSGAPCCEITTAAATKAPTIDPPKPNVHPELVLVAIVEATPSSLPRRPGPSVAPHSLAPLEPDRSLFARHCALLL